MMSSFSEAQYENLSDYSISYEYVPDAGEKAVKSIAVILLVLVTVFGAIGNTLVLLSLTIGTRKLGITSILLGSLAFTDLIINIWLVPIETITHLFTPVWKFGSFLCIFTGFLSTFAQSSSACMLLAISCERFLVILYPLTSRTMLTRRRTFILVLITWTISAGLASFPASYKQVVTHNHEQFCTASYIVAGDHRMRVIMYLYALLILYLIPLGGMAVANTCVIRALIKSSKYTKKLQSVKSLEKGVKYSASPKNGGNVAIAEKPIYNNNSAYAVGEDKSVMDSMATSGSGDDPFPPVAQAKQKPQVKKKSHTSVAQRQKVVMMLLAVVLLYAICWLPNFIFGALYMLFKVPTDTYFMIVLEPFVRICYSCNSALNPIVYGFMSKNFRQRIQHGFSRCIRYRLGREGRANSFNSAYTLSARGSAMSHSTRQTRYTAIPRA